MQRHTATKVDPSLPQSLGVPTNRASPLTPSIPRSLDPDDFHPSTPPSYEPSITTIRRPLDTLLASTSRRTTPRIRRILCSRDRSIITPYITSRPSTRRNGVCERE